MLMTRSTDVDVAPQPATDAGELQARCDVANQGKADIFLSLHMDSFTNGSARGTTVYYYGKGTKAMRCLAENVKDRVCWISWGQTIAVRKVQTFMLSSIRLCHQFWRRWRLCRIRRRKKMMNSAKGIEKVAMVYLTALVAILGLKSGTLS